MTYSLLDKCHSKLLVRNAVCNITHIFNLLTGNVKMDALKNVLKTFSSIIHKSQLKSPLVKEGFCQCPP